MCAVLPHSTSLGLRDAATVLFAPGSVFRNIAEAGRYGWALAALILLTTLIGWATVQTGLIDRQVDRQTRTALADLEREQSDLLTRLELSERMKTIRESAVFTKLVAGGGAIVASPLLLISSLMLTAAALFAVVALTGNKPDYPILMSICVYSAVVDVFAALLRLAMMIAFRSIDVGTSLALFVPRTQETQTLRLVLSAFDPFSIWFWVLVGTGLTITGQLSRRASVVVGLIFGFVSIGIRMAAALAVVLNG